MLLYRTINLLNRSLTRMGIRRFLTVTNNYPDCRFKPNNFSNMCTRNSLVSICKPSNALYFNNKDYCVDNKSCWHCNSVNIIDNFCESCRSIQPLKKNLNHFEILGIKKTFQINKTDLVKLYRKLQNVFHPDKFSTKSEEEQSLAVEYSTAVNKAYNILSNPVSRAEYMLSEAGQSISEGEISLEADFLMDIMEINEKLADAKDKETVKFISDKNKDIMDNLFQEAEKCFGSEDIAGAKNIVVKLKYYYNINEKVKEYERKHGIFYE